MDLPPDQVYAVLTAPDNACIFKGIKVRPCACAPSHPDLAITMRLGHSISAEAAELPWGTVSGVPEAARPHQCLSVGAWTCLVARTVRLLFINNFEPAGCGCVFQRVAYRKVLEDDGRGRQKVEVEQVAAWRILMFHGSFSTRLLVSQDQRQGTVSSLQPCPAWGGLHHAQACAAAALYQCIAASGAAQQSRLLPACMDACVAITHAWHCRCGP